MNQSYKTYNYNLIKAYCNIKEWYSTVLEPKNENFDCISTI